MNQNLLRLNNEDVKLVFNQEVSITETTKFAIGMNILIIKKIIGILVGFMNYFCIIKLLTKSITQIEMNLRQNEI